jgi:hypothetical protein
VFEIGKRVSRKEIGKERMIRELFSTGPGQVSIDIVFGRAMLRNEFGLSIQFLITSSVGATEVESFSTLGQKR